MTVAVGTALGGGSQKVKHIDLAPATVRDARSRRPVVFAGIAVAAVAAGGYAYLQQGKELDAVKAERSEVEAQLATAQAQAANRVVKVATSDATSTLAVIRLTRSSDVDWARVMGRLDALGEPLGVTVTGVVGTTNESASGSATPGAATAAASGSAPASASSPSAAAAAGGSSTSQTATATTAGGLGRLKVTGTAADLDTIAAWVDAVTTDPTMGSVWVDTTTKTAQPDGSQLVQFTATVTVSRAAVVVRHLPGAS
jgi:hypothetical protein